MTQQTKVPVVAVVLAAGSGVRFDPAKPKQLVALNGKPIVAWSIEAFENDEHVDDIVVVVNNTVREAVEQLIDDASYAKVRAIITGGAERSDSTEAALTTLADAGIPQDAKILIHDAVRPFVSRQEIDGCIDALDEFTAATVACPSTDTILLTQDLGDREVIQSVPERRHSFRAQTPQAFRFGTIREGGRRPGFPAHRRHPRGRRLSARPAGCDRRRIAAQHEGDHAGRHAACPRAGECACRRPARAAERTAARRQGAAACHVRQGIRRRRRVTCRNYRW